MPNRGKDLPPGAFARYQSGVSLRAVAQEFDVPESTLRRRLAGAGADLRQGKPLRLPFEEVRRLYEQEGMSARELAPLAGVALQTVQRRLARAGVHIRDWHEKTARTREKISAAQHRKVDEARLRDLHVQGMSCQEMAEVFGCGDEAVRRALIRLGLPRLAPQARPERNVFWRGGYAVDEEGYILVHMPDHPDASGGYVRQHRLVMAEKLGRPLAPGEVVDHRNRDTSDNDPGNLRLFPSNAEHLRATLTGRRKLPAAERERLRQEAVRRAYRRVAAILAASGNGADPSP